MTAALHLAVVPGYLLLCLVLGGSTQGIATNLALQVLGVVLIGWAVLRQKGQLPRPARWLALLTVLTLLMFAVQLVPLPPSWWTLLPGREPLVAGYRLLDQPLPSLPLSLAPTDTLATLNTLIPPLAVLAGMLLIRAYQPLWIAVAVLLCAFAGVLLGALQVSSGNPLQSPWYLYDAVSFGSATGFFSNANHMGILLLLSLPFLMAVVRHIRTRAASQRSGTLAFALALAGVLVLGVGILLNGSLAVLLLGLPVAVATWLGLMRDKRRTRDLVLAAVALGIAVVAAVFLTPWLLSFDGASFESRQRIWATSLQAIGSVMPWGSGFGTFAPVYRMYEAPAAVSATIVNHAHNDYLELALEGGVPVLVLLALFLWWWARRVAVVVKAPVGDGMQMAAAIVSAALLLHSLVDFPLRMPALSALFAACIAMLAQPPRSGKHTMEDLWPTRHLRL